MTNRLWTTCGFAASLVLSAAAVASAQTVPTARPDTFINVSGGIQMQKRDVDSVNSFEVFEETATVSAKPTIGRGLVIDASVGRRVWHNVIVSLDFSSFHRGGLESSFTASIPSPQFFNQPTMTAGSVSDFEQSTIAGSIIVTWLHPLTDTVEVAVFAGPSFMKVTQSVLTGSAASPTGPVTMSTVTEPKNTAKAGMLGVDLAYKLNDHYGAALFVRYAGGEVDLSSSPKMKVGGVQTGIGLRVRF